MDHDPSERPDLSQLPPDGPDAAASYRALFDQHPDGVVVLNPETARPIYFNDQAPRQLGYSREEFVRLSIADLEASESAQEVRATIARVLSDGKADFDTVHRTKQGELRDVHVTAQLVQFGDLTLYHCIWRDVTERKRVEAALRVSEERLSRAQRSARAGVWDWDIPTQRLVWSPELFELFGVDPEASGATFDVWRSVLHPEDREGAERRIAESVDSGTLLSSEYRIIRPDALTARRSSASSVVRRTR
jgi:two-component system, sensor histidine kinase and response regulator